MPMTLGLQNMRRQTDEAFPGRDRTSDGGIGDEAHRLKTSGHNPDDTPGSKPAWNSDPDTLPEWRAWDMDADLRTPGVTTQQYVDHVRHLDGLATVVRYLIFNGKIYHEDDGFAPARYAGADPHTSHVHVEGAWTQTGDNNTTFNFRLEEIPVALTPEDKAWISAEIRDAVKDNNAAGAAAVRIVARTNKEFLSDTEKLELINATAVETAKLLGPADPQPSDPA